MATFEEDEPTIPRAGLNKLIKDVLPGLRVSGEARDCLAAMGNEFIHRLSTLANRICEQQQKRTITPEHVLEALKQMGFESYVTECESTLTDLKKAVAERRRKSNSRWDTSGLSEEELLKMQQELFEQAKREQNESECAEWREIQRQMSSSSVAGLHDEENDDDEDYS